MKAAMADDKAKHNILPISQLGIMQITRQRHDESNSSGVYESCPYCNGRGIVKSPRAVSIEIRRKVTNMIRRFRIEEGKGGSVAQGFLVRCFEESAWTGLPLDRPDGRGKLRT